MYISYEGVSVCVCVCVIILFFFKTREGYGGDKIGDLNKYNTYTIYNNKSNTNSENGKGLRFHRKDPGPDFYSSVKRTFTNKDGDVFKKSNGGAFWCDLDKNPKPSDIEKCINDFLAEKSGSHRRLHFSKLPFREENTKFEGDFDSVYFITQPDRLAYPHSQEQVQWKVIQYKPSN